MPWTEKDFIIRKTTPVSDTFEITEAAPSNIALVKYWGKYGLQLPINPSISFTLNKSKTVTKAIITPLNKPTNRISFKFFLDNRYQPGFEPKIERFFNLIKDYAPYIFQYDWQIYSQNTFPHSSGIASSASGFAALAKIIIALEKKLFNTENQDYLLKKTSFLARLGSGSAARSIENPVMIWGKHPKIKNTTNLYAITPEFDLHPVFQNFKDSIVLVEKGQKKVSSTAGHALMEQHPFKSIRVQQAFDNTLAMYQVLKTGDLIQFIEIVEAEALSLHALMMTSNPNYILMQSGTLQIIKAVRELRKEKNIPVCFTLDAGANVHVLYPQNIEKNVQNFLNNHTFEVIHDYI